MTKNNKNNLGASPPHSSLVSRPAKCRRGRAIRCTPRSHSYSVGRGVACNAPTTSLSGSLRGVAPIPRASALQDGLAYRFSYFLSCAKKKRHKNKIKL